MATFGQVKLCVIAAVALLSSQSGLGWAQAVATTKHDALESSLPRDGQHDFDFLFGRWKVHVKRKVTGTDRWKESDGYGIYRKVWTDQHRWQARNPFIARHFPKDVPFVMSGLPKRQRTLDICIL